MHSVSDRIADLSMIWKQVSLVFPYFDRCAVDWDQAYLAYLPRVLEAESDKDFHLLLAQFMNELGDGHTDYAFPRELLNETGYLPFTLRYVQGVYCLDAVMPAQQQFLCQEIQTINGMPFSQFVKQACQYSYHQGFCLPVWRLQQYLTFVLKKCGNVLCTPAGQFSFDLLSERPANLIASALTLPIAYMPMAQSNLDIRLYKNSILYVRLDDMMQENAAHEIRAALEHFSPDGLILDLRENIGGMTMYGARIAELLISGQFHACQKRTRSMTGLGYASASQLMQWSEERIAQHIAAGYSTQEEINRSKSLLNNMHFDHYQDAYGAESHVACYHGPCIVLTSRRTVSAAEDFIAMLKTNHRATIMGTETRGTTGTPLIQTLRCGGMMRICSVGYKLLDGTDFIGRGIRPDIPCEITVEEYQHSYDAVLAKALNRITMQNE